MNSNSASMDTSSVDVSKLVEMIQSKGTTEGDKLPVKRKKKPPLVPPKPAKKPAHLLSKRNANQNVNVVVKGDVNANVSATHNEAPNEASSAQPTKAIDTTVLDNQQPKYSRVQEASMDSSSSVNSNMSQSLSELHSNVAPNIQAPTPTSTLNSPDNSRISGSQSNSTSPIGISSATVSPAHHRRSLEDVIAEHARIPVPQINDDELVVLPERYVSKIRTSKYKVFSNLEDIAEDRILRQDDRPCEENNNAIISDSLADREKDLATAIKWLRQEILLMKQQDKALMTRLLELGARLHQIRGMCSSHSISSTLLHVGLSSSSLDINNWSSFMSLDEGELGKPLDPLPHPKTGRLSLDSNALARSVSTRAATHADRMPVVIRRKASLPAVDINEDLLEEEYFLS